MSQTIGKRWTRVKDGYIGGVCGGLAKTLDFNPNLLRLLWVVGVLFAGLTIWMYIVMWMFLPREDKQFEPDKPLFLGVCLRLAHRLGIEVSWVRILVVLAHIPSLGAMIIVYLLLYVLLPKDNEIST